MELDIVIPTYNRCNSLERAIRSLLKSHVPEGNKIRVLVADNRSNDETMSVTERLAHETTIEVVYINAKEGQGRSFALNAGISLSTADLIGFIDDDEEINPDWFTVVFRAFSDPAIDYIGGPYLPAWPSTPPKWIFHPHILTAIAGAVEHGDSPVRYAEPGFKAPLLGGNCVMRRGCFVRVGLYNVNLGRRPNGGSGEDSEMHQRMLQAGMNGMYCPNLLIRHHVSSERFNKNYMRRWQFLEGVSDGHQYRHRRIEWPSWFGLPRYLYGSAARVPFRWLKSLLYTEGPAKLFYEELVLWRVVGAIYGRHFGS